MNLPLPAWLNRRPRILNVLHAAHLYRAYSQTIAAELECLRKQASGRKAALEIGTHMGVSAGVIAGALAEDGKLVCVDPWESLPGKEHPCFSICRRELGRQGVLAKIEFLKGFSHEVENDMPQQCDFVFVDGDHSYSGLETDWGITLRRLVPGGVVCLHDTTVPPNQPHRNPGSVAYFNEAIKQHSSFEWIDGCHSLNVLRRIA